MNLFGAAVAVVGAVGPGSAATLKLSTGSVGNADFTRTPQYRVVAATVWVQALSSDELAHVGDLSQQGALRVVYVAGDVGGMDRAAGTGGDIVNFDGADWLVVRQMEQWGDSMVEADGAQAATGDVTEGTVLTALGQWLCATIPLPADAVMVGQVNRMAPPCGAFAIMTVAGRGRIATNRTTYGAGCRIVWMQQQVDVRVDLHGAGAGDGAGRIALLFRDPACAAFLAGYGTIAPLYAAPPRQRDFVSDAAQYEDVWQVTVSLQVNSTATFAQDFANALNVGIFETDATFPPE